MEQMPGDLIPLYTVPTRCLKKAMLYFTCHSFLSGLPPHEINMKIAATIMLLRNLNISRGHYNGARYTVVAALYYAHNYQKLRRHF